MSTLTYKCPGCDGPLSFDAATQHWSCKFCGGSFALEELQKQHKDDTQNVQDVQNDTAKEPASGQQQPEKEPAFFEDGTLYTCPSCAAQVLTDNNTAATFCSFCHNPTIISERLTGVLQPEKVIPFSIDKKGALELLGKYCKKKPLIPKDFSSDTQLEKISGIYVPFWLFDADTLGQMTASCSNVTHWTSGGYRYTKTDKYKVERAGTAQFALMPADASKALDDDMMNKLEPYDMSGMVDFSMSYLSGFLAEKYDLTSDEVFERVEERTFKATEDLIRKTMSGYTNVNVGFKDFKTTKKLPHYALLPVWMLTYKYRGKIHLFAANAQTGKVVGNLPVSKKRAFAWFSAACAVVTGLWFVISLFLV